MPFKFQQFKLLQQLSTKTILFLQPKVSYVEQGLEEERSILIQQKHGKKIH